MTILSETILKQIRKNRKELKDIIEAVAVRLPSKLEHLNRRFNNVEGRKEKMLNSIERLERKAGENNIIIFGLKTDKQGTITDLVKREIRNLVDINIVESDLSNFYTFGKQNNPIKTEFTFFLKRTSILKGVENLRGINISVANDLTVKQPHVLRYL